MSEEGVESSRTSAASLGSTDYHDIVSTIGKVNAGDAGHHFRRQRKDNRRATISGFSPLPKMFTDSSTSANVTHQRKHSFLGLSSLRQTFGNFAKNPWEILKERRSTW